jgi:serine/threonine protein kinase
MSWINSRQFTISNRNGRHYVFRRNNAGNTEINVPRNITTKAQAVAWLKAHPNKVARPNRYKAKRGAAARQGNMKPFERMINGKKMVRFINKEGREYFRPAPSKEPNYFSNRKFTPTNWTCAQLKTETSRYPMKAIGKGRQGIVFVASRYSNGRYPFALKVAPRDLRSAHVGEPQPAEVEFKIQNAVMRVAPEGVVRVRQILRCTDFVKPSQIDMKNVQNSNSYDKSKQIIIVMEYAPKGSLKKWFDTSSPSDAGIRKVISQILVTLKKIKDVYPYFNHNDLHLENVFMSDRGPLLGDFGWARLERNGTNPAVNRANGTETASFWGVGPKTDPRYDHHFILNEIREWVVRHGGVAKYPESLKFLNMAIPIGYRGPKDAHVSEWRLKYGDPCENLPSLTRLVRTPYVSGIKRLVTSPNLQAARRRLRKVSSRSLPPPLSPIGPPRTKKVNYKLSPSSGRAKIQSKNTGRWVYADLQSMNFLKNLASKLKVNVAGIRSKANMAKKIFSR